MPRKMVRSSGPFSTWAFGLESTREISWIGTGSMTSTSPDSRAATRVASEPIGVKMISLMLCSALRHQFGLALKTVLTPGWWLSTEKAPVPLAFSEAKLGVVAAACVGSTALLASAHFLLIMYQVSHCELRMGLGTARTKSTV